MIPICRNIQNNDFYSWDGEKFTNLRTGVSGIIDDETARKVFLFNVEATQIFHEYPLVKELINKLNLKRKTNE
jgi:hypothetical protein